MLTGSCSHRRSLSIKEQQLGVDHPDGATSLSNLAALNESQGCSSEVEPLYVRIAYQTERAIAVGEVGDRSLVPTVTELC